MTSINILVYLIDKIDLQTSFFNNNNNFLSRTMIETGLKLFNYIFIHKLSKEFNVAFLFLQPVVVK